MHIISCMTELNLADTTKFLEIIDSGQFVDLIKSKTKSIFFCIVPNTQ